MSWGTGGHVRSHTVSSQRDEYVGQKGERWVRW